MRKRWKRAVKYALAMGLLGAFITLYVTGFSDWSFAGWMFLLTTSVMFVYSLIIGAPEPKEKNKPDPRLNDYY